jgi:hypothetical protein
MHDTGTLRIRTKLLLIALGLLTIVVSFRKQRTILETNRDGMKGMRSGGFELTWMRTNTWK